MTLSQSLREYRGPLILLVVLLLAAYSRILAGMAADWFGNDNNSHGVLIPLIAAYFVYRDRASLADIPVAPNGWGLPLALAACAQFVIAYLATELYNMRLSLLVFLAGAILCLFGWTALKRLGKYLAFLILMIPVPYLLYDMVAFPLKLFVSRVSVLVLQLMGYAVWRDGNIISFPNIVLEVADACSGLRSLMSLLAFAVAMAWLALRSTTYRLVLIAMAVPIAIFTNMLRVIATGVMARAYGRQAAEGFFHESTGLMVFLLATILLAGCCWALKKIEDRHAA